MAPELPGDTTHDQHPEKVQAVGRSTFQARSKTVPRPGLIPTTSNLQASVPETERKDKGEEPKFSLKEVQQLLGYTIAARGES